MKFKKPKFWDKKKPTFLSYLLLPFSFPLIINNFFLGLRIIQHGCCTVKCFHKYNVVVALLIQRGCCTVNCFDK